MCTVVSMKIPLSYRFVKTYNFHFHGYFIPHENYFMAFSYPIYIITWINFIALYCNRFVETYDYFHRFLVKLYVFHIPRNYFMGFSCPMNILGFGYDTSFMVSFYEFIGFSYSFHEHFVGIPSSSGLTQLVVSQLKFVQSYNTNFHLVS